VSAAPAAEVDGSTVATVGPAIWTAGGTCGASPVLCGDVHAATHAPKHAAAVTRFAPLGCIAFSLESSRVVDPAGADAQRSRMVDAERAVESSVTWTGP